MPAQPTLVVVSGPPGSGKTTLAHSLADELGCPAIIRDEIKQGMVMSTGIDQPGADDLNIPAVHAFDTLSVLLQAVVAEAAYQDRLWRPGLEPLADIASLRIIRCTTSTSAIVERMAERANSERHRAAHGDRQLLTDSAAGTYAPEQFADISLDVPTLLVDTSDGYQPGNPEITAFIRTQ
ncbi:AAA family ATPase [Streptomyces sp. NPDC001549]|uniref:AAA family ATPase n=1 Tax=Streptomyces sp. NPDC001549 TaxID=3364586 RepID=UPI0036C6EFF0